MTLIEILLTILIQTLFCLGFRTLISEGMILHFIREPFEYHPDSKLMKFLKRRLLVFNSPDSEYLFNKTQQYVKISNRLSYILKPILLCVVCFSSVWGAAVFIALHGIDMSLLPYLIVSCICTSFAIKLFNDKIDW